jgi:transposase-like protein
LVPVHLRESDRVDFCRCRELTMAKPIARDPIYRKRGFDAEIIELCVRWYISYRLSYRDLVELMADRGVAVSHTTIMR